MLVPTGYKAPKHVNLKIDVYLEFSSKLEYIWRSFEKNAKCYCFQCFDWVAHSQQTIGEPLHNVHPCVVTVSENDHIVALFPFGIRSHFGVRRLEWVGIDHADYQAPLLHRDWNLPANEFRELWLRILAMLPRFDVIYFQKQPELIGNINNPFMALEGLRKGASACFALLPDTWDEYKKKQLRKKLLSDSQRQRRRLAEKGTLRFKIAETPEEYELFVKTMIRQKRRRYRETGAWDMLSIEQHRKFYELFSQQVGESGSIHCAALILDKYILATHWGLVHCRRFYYLMPAFEGGKWRRYSPGKLLLETLIEWSISQKLQIFDFTGGWEQYKNEWCNQEMFLYEYIKAVNPLGLSYIVIKQMKRRAGRIKWVRKSREFLLAAYRWSITSTS